MKEKFGFYLRNIFQNRRSIQSIALVIVLVIFLFRVVGNLSQGYFIFKPFSVDENTQLTKFQSTITPFSISYPQDWIAHDLPDGSHGDMEIIASIRPLSPNAPYIVVMHRSMGDGNLTNVAKWGEMRLVDNLSEPSSYKSEPIGEISVDERPALIRNFEYTIGQKKYYCNHVYLLNRENAFIVEFCVPDEKDSPELQRLFEKMTNSIELYQL